MVKIQIVNVVATASLGQPVDFDELRKCKEIFHDSDVYSGRVAYFKTPKMQGKVSIFLSGKMISVGTKGEITAYGELESARDFLVAKGFIEAVELKPQTQNMVVTADFEKSVNLENWALDSKAIYEPEQFPGAILRINEPFKTSILVFASGKTVITGLKSSEQIQMTVDRLEKMLEFS